MNTDSRANYETLKKWASDAYFEGCRDHAIPKGWCHEEIIGYVVYQFEDYFSLNIEKLMWDVVIYILSAGWNAERAILARTYIEASINSAEFDSLVASLPNEERNEFMHDLKAVGLIK